MSVLLIAEHNNKEIRPFTLNAITAASQIDSDLHVLVAGNSCGDVAKAVSEVPLVKKVLHVDAAHYENFLPENFAPLIVKISENYSHIISSANTFGKNLMPRVAALLDTSQVSDIIKIVSADTFIRPIYAGNALAKVRSKDRKKFITVRSTSFSPAKVEGGAANIIEGPETEVFSGTDYIERDLSESDRPELTAAKVVVSGGRGLGSADNFKILDPLADKLGAAIGASRAAVDAGYVPNDYQVGQTGKVVAPELYMAIGISGAIQHLAGMKDSKIIVAINKDEDAPIFQIADYGLVGDLFEIVPELIKKLT